MKTPRLWLCLWLAAAWVTTPTVALAAPAAERKPRPKRKNPPKKPAARRAPTATEASEAALHQERLAVLTRLKEVNAELRDGELAAVLERIKQKENQRHTQARQLIKKEQDAAAGAVK